MSLFKKILKGTEKSPYDVKKGIEITGDDDERRRRDDVGRDGTRTDGEGAARRLDGIEIVYFASGAINERLVESLKGLNKDIQVCFLHFFSN